MLTKLVVHLYAWIIEVYLWLTLLVAGIVGYFMTVPLLNSAGAILENEVVWQIYGALFFVVATFLSAAALVGPLLMLVEIRESVKSLEAKSIGSSSGHGAISAVVKEPSL